MLQDLELKELGSFFYFILPESFGHLGVKTVGLVCEEILQRKLIDPKSYLAGFQKLPSEVPGLGNFPFSEYKASFRLSPELRTLAEKKLMPGFDEIVAAAVEQIGGFVDACHMHAAAATVAIGDEEKLLRVLNKLLKKR